MDDGLIGEETVGRRTGGLVEESPCRIWVRWPRCIASVGSSLDIIVAERPGREIQPLATAVERVGIAGDPMAAWNQ